MSAQRQEIVTAEERPAPVSAQSETVAILSMIERAARDPSIDLDRMERLFEMREKMVARERETAFNAAMAAAQAEMPRVLRDAANSHTQSRYARLETIAKKITPIITRHGFSLSFDTGEPARPGEIRIVCSVAHKDGHTRTHQVDLPSDTAGAQGNRNKTPVQGFGSTVSYGRRYLTLMIFNVALTNEDDDGNAGRDAGPTITEDQLIELRDLVEAVGADLSKFVRHLGVESLADLPANRFDAAVRDLKRKERR
ncbi:hypothetical protein LKMONMHP_1115 [Methylobacterium organophilum]|uniref:ERF family protein n=1 Tax=Methylobacterium organophilum TaxID=410 RepID=A0ABQ4T3P7_METOR|nr:hypothetical protein LKMONMHP_1115 [Methylobacterium organophilum]